MNINLFKGKGYKRKLIGYYNSISFFLLMKQIQRLKVIQNIHGLSSKNIHSGNWIVAAPCGVIGGRLYNNFDSNRFLRRQFAVLGCNFDYENKKIPWHIDPLSKKQWPKKYFKRLFPVANTTDSSDCKIPWELSRFQHLPSMAQAYFSTRDIQYAREAIWQINDWINENPCPYGINWTCAMEAAIRACNWMWAWWAFKDTDSWTEDFNLKFLKSMWQHGWYIEKNLENKGGIETNHYLSDVVGLLFIGVMFPQFKDAEKWKNFGIRELIRCMDKMVYADGVSFENSTAYHRLVLELFTYSAILCKRNDIELPARFWDRLERMFEFIFYTMRPDGRMPMIGDNDDGRFFILSNYYDWNRWDFRYLLSIGAVLFRRMDFKAAAGREHEEIQWLFGEEEIRQYERM